MMRKVKSGKILAHQFKHGLLAELIVKFTPNLERQLLVHFSKKFIYPRPTKIYLSVEIDRIIFMDLFQDYGNLIYNCIHPFQIKYWRIFINNINFRNHDDSEVLSQTKFSLVFNIWVYNFPGCQVSSLIATTLSQHTMHCLLTVLY